MPCNKDTCGNYTPAGDGTGETCATPCGVTVERKIWPVWDTKRINAPQWTRDRIMYYYDDVCERAQVHAADGTTPNIPKDTSGTQVEYGLSGVENPNAGRVRKALQSGYWWQGDGILCPPNIYRGSISTAGAASPCRYWDHYPAEQSFEPIRSDTWFSYLYDTSKGVTGKPCYVYCYYTYTLSASTPNGKGTTTTYNTYYGIRKVPYTCNCDPKESYVNYSLEDGKITPESETDPYPLVWTVGTKQQRIAFSYPTGGQVAVKNITTTSAQVRMVKSNGNIPSCNTRQVGTVNSEWGATFYDWSTIFNTSGPVAPVVGPNLPAVGNELWTITGMGLYKGFYSAGQSYTIDLWIQEKGIPGSGYISDGRKRKNFGYISATFRRHNYNGTLAGSLVKFGSIRGGDNKPENGVEYDLWARVEVCPKNLWKVGQIKFGTVTTTTVAPSVPTTFHMGEPKQVTGSSGTDLNAMGFYEVWNGNRNASYMSSQGNFWKSKNTKVIQDYSIPNGTIIRCEISSYYDDVASKYYTRWKMLGVIKYGNGYTVGNGSVYSNQDVYYLYYPSADDPNRVGVALMISGTSDGDWSQGTIKIEAGDTINGWTVTDVNHSDDEFNMHVAYLKDGTNNFTKDTNYTSSSGLTVNVKAGWGIKDRAAIVGRYEFQRKEIIYVTANANPDVPQEDLDVVKPQLQAVVQNGKVTEIQILKPGSNLQDPLIEPILIAIQDPPGSINQTLYLQLLQEGVEPNDAYVKAKGTVRKAFAEPIFTAGVLTGIKILDGGSGYSSTTPPNVAVPYIARKFVTVDVAATTAKAKEPGMYQLFQESELFKTLANTPYEKTSYSWDQTNPTKVQSALLDANGLFTGKYKFDITKTKKTTKQERGYSFTDYSNDKSIEYSEKTTINLRGSIKDLERQKNAQVYVRPKVGISKESAQAFLPPSNSNRKTTKNKDYTNLLSSISKQVDNNTQYFKKFSTDQKRLIETGTTDVTVYSSVRSQLPADQQRQLDTIQPSKLLDSKFTDSPTDPPEDDVSKSSISAAKDIKLDTKSNDTGSYYSKEFKSFLIQVQGPVYSKKVITNLDANDKLFEDNINSMWQIDTDENRTFVYDGSATTKVKYGFFNLPCATREKKYLVQSYCPDPRKNTFMSINVGVKVAGKNFNDERGPCKQCLYDNATVLAAYNSLVNQYGSGNVDIADAYCSTYTFTTTYSGQSDGVARGIPFGSYSLPYASTYFGGYARSYIKTQFANQYVYEGCRDYQFSGNLEILHDRTLETEVFAQAINRYGNPYDFICDTSYEDRPSIEETIINNTTSASTEYLTGAAAQLTNPTLYSE